MNYHIAMNRILIFIKKIIPEKIFLFFQPAYHFGMGFLAGLVYGFPSKKMIVVGVTGTTGKTTSVYLTAKMLKKKGLKVGYTSTALLSDGKKEWLNDKKMTMLGRFFTQKMLRKMVKNGCQVAIVETTSEGIRQFRHRFINYDIVAFTGIYPEHIESHGSFKKYKNEKLKLFKHLEKSRHKKIKFSNLRNISKTIIVNGDDKYANEFGNFKIARKIIFTKKNADVLQKEKEELIKYKFLEVNNTGVKFLFDNEIVQLKLLGEFNATNATIAGCVGKALGLSRQEIRRGLEKIKNIPGRLEKIEEGQDFTIIVDYAFEPKALEKLYETVDALGCRKIIHVLGSTGGGRDIARRKPLGEVAGKGADIAIIANEDPYDDDPMEIIKDVAEGARQVGKNEKENLFLIEDRQKAIEKALEMAEKNDIVLITGKGSEQAICLKNGKMQKWDDREVVKKLLKNINSV